MTLLITSRGPPCTAVFVFFFVLRKCVAQRPDRPKAVLEHIADVRRAIIKGSTLAVLHRINEENLSEEKNM